MLEGAPLPIEALPLVRDFLGEDLLLGHNVGFDAAFLYDSFQKYLNCPLKNDTLDHLTISRKLLPDLPHHRLGDVAAALGVPYEGAHGPWRTVSSPTAAMRSCGPWPYLRAQRGTSSAGSRKRSPQSPGIPAYRATPSTKSGWCSPAAWPPPNMRTGWSGRGPGGEGGHGKNGFPGRARPWGQAPAGQKRRARHPAPRAFLRLLGEGEPSAIDGPPGGRV